MSDLIGKGGSIDLLKQLLDLQAARQKVAARNLANAGSDEYVPRKVEFANELNKALGKVELRQTNSRHLGGTKARGDHRITIVDSEVTQDEATLLEQTVAELTDAQLAYETVARLMSRRLATLRTAITGKP